MCRRSRRWSRDADDLAGKRTGERIQILRERKGLSRPVLAGLVGMSASWLKGIEQGRRLPPRLHSGRAGAAGAQIGDDIGADHRAYYWSWAEWIAPITDPHAAARKISAVLRAVPEPTHG